MPPSRGIFRNPARRVLHSFMVLLLSIGALVAATPSLLAQSQPDSPRVQLFAGYSYLRYDSKSIGFADTTGLNGWNFMAAYNLFRGFGVVAEASGDYGLHLNLRDVLVGPQFFYQRGKFTYFGHLEFGKARSFDNVGTGNLDTQMAIEVGAGVDRDITRHFAFRIVQADYLHTKLFQTTQNNLQLSTGVVYHWHSIKWKPRKPPPPPASPAPSAPAKP